MFTMNFDDLKLVWDSQNEEPHYAIDEAGLHAILRQKSQTLKKLIFWQEAQTYGSSLFILLAMAAVSVGLIFDVFRHPATATDYSVLAIGATGWLYFAGKVYFSRRQQRQRTARFTESIRDELERDLEQLDYEIDGRQDLVSGFIPPYVGGILFMWVFFRAMGAPEWMILPMIVAMIIGLVVETGSQRRLVERDLEPRREELESLRKKLLQNEPNDQ